ncbi:hypothetical protein [Streptomyces klenkii]
MHTAPSERRAKCGPRIAGTRPTPLSRLRAARGAALPALTRYD